jgi:hypothetical protein
MRSLILAGLLALGVTGCGDDSLARRIYAAAVAHPEESQVDLGALIGGEWDRLVVFSGEPPVTVVDDALGFHWDGYASGMGDGWIVVAAKAESVVSWSYVPWRGSADGEAVEFWMNGWWVDATHADGNFTIVEFAPGHRLVLCRPPECP